MGTNRAATVGSAKVLNRNPVKDFPGAAIRAIIQRQGSSPGQIAY